MHHQRMETAMARFTKEQMLNELRVIFLFEADHILMGAGREVAERFIGFEVPEDGQYCFEQPDRVDLRRFPISNVFERAYEAAFFPSVLTSFDDSEVQDLVQFMMGTPRAGGINAAGEPHSFMTPDGYCQSVADAVFARWKLEWDPAGLDGHTFTTRELALLANMTEGAVRNAIAHKSEDGLRVVAGMKPVSVARDEAWRWLQNRRGFIPSPKRPSEDRFLCEHLRNIQSAAALGDLIRTQLSTSKQQTLGWTNDEIDEWCNGSFRFDEARACQLARALDFDVPLFVGKALEVSLRRDSSI
jgi:hypothetical protein